LEPENWIRKKGIKTRNEPGIVYLSGIPGLPVIRLDSGIV